MDDENHEIPIPIPFLIVGAICAIIVRYKIIREVGNGTFGSIWRALNKQSAEVVAIKKIKKKYYSWEECINLREVKSLRKMNHPNIVKLKEVVRENDVLYFVFEYMECNLYHLLKERRKFFSEVEVRTWCFQVHTYINVDTSIVTSSQFHILFKLENLLVSKDIIKVADFGLAREINSQPPFIEYRAPEVLFQSPTYGPAVEMWAMGAIMAELFTLRPLFPGSRKIQSRRAEGEKLNHWAENAWRNQCHWQMHWSYASHRRPNMQSRIVSCGCRFFEGSKMFLSPRIDVA
ncbi:unnamed protein product [Fraxinus pennsylvanica]|uniref:non-specific serine/threonine protein kinase n=1 Tax=Fraxinus pennsylvanica TaxID=56036 RepID=A0AAD1ZTU4_9LAMI|nr:unnamed protein product [Fraxinus pennsylvanica]